MFALMIKVPVRVVDILAPRRVKGDTYKKPSYPEYFIHVHFSASNNAIAAMMVVWQVNQVRCIGFVKGDANEHAYTYI